MGQHAPWKSPAGTTEKLSRHAPEFAQRIGNSESRKYPEMEVLRDRVRVTPVVPAGLNLHRYVLRQAFQPLKHAFERNIKSVPRG
jgi:hypothetical protein